MHSPPVKKSTIEIKQYKTSVKEPSQKYLKGKAITNQEVTFLLLRVYLLKRSVFAPDNPHLWSKELNAINVLAEKNKRAVHFQPLT